MQLISKPPTDKFTYTLFKSLLLELTCEYNAYYIWSNPPYILEKFLKNIDFSKKPNVILGIKDSLDLWTEFNFWRETVSAGAKLLNQIAQRYPNTNFIIFVSVENLNLELFDAPNIQIIPWGGDCLNQIEEYQNLNPVIDKNFSSVQYAISLNRNLRDHRIVYLSYLFGQNLDKNIVVSSLGIANINKNIEPPHFLDRISWEFSEYHTPIREIIFNGYDKFFNNQDLIIDDYDIYPAVDNDNILNFEKLRERYRNSFVEIVTESSFTSPNFMITEKTMHSFYACNFPIILGGKGLVSHLRDIGFDMFDDIINHSYDTISNPFDRIIAAINNNKKLLLDGDFVKHQWHLNQERFIKNINTANNIDRYYESRTKNLWKDIKWK